MKSQLIQPDQIREAVRDSYALRATQFLNNTAPAEGGCCGVNPKAQELGYTAAELANLPAEIAEVTLGCGDPTSIANLQPGMTVLDLGSGGGFDCLLAAKKVGQTGRVIGVDMTPEMLSLAWKNVAKAGARNVEFRYGHIEKLPVESDTVDVILSNCVINLSPDKPAVFREAHRVLKPGGKFAVSDIVADREITPEAQANLGSYCSCVAGASEEGWYLDQLRAAGFTRVNVVSRAPYADVPDSSAKTWSVKVEAWK